MRNFSTRGNRPDQPPVDRNAAKAQRQHYLKLADAQSAAGDQVAAENYYQHAEHFLRCTTEGTR
ncbi:DUF4167 domain-containing protein [Pelagibacterium nitratireducens]|uniref:DUF4167 domain-containing protein n=1 Tax=Pelagibacterium nitratireducens TaxID=1046114 RepID=A0ABZ2I0I0_9HYPH